LIKELKYAYAIHLCKYLGIALVSGSIVHAGTLGGNNNKYLGLIVVGVLLTVLGNYLEYEVKNIKVGVKLLALAIILSFGTGMLSGGIQHFADNPSYSAMLLSLGAVITFFALALKDFPGVLNFKAVPIAIAASAVLYFGLPTVSSIVMSDHGEPGHHEEVTTEGHTH
jgi:hypothetical protein